MLDHAPDFPDQYLPFKRHTPWYYSFVEVVLSSMISGPNGFGRRSGGEPASDRLAPVNTGQSKKSEPALLSGTRRMCPACCERF